MTRRLYRSESDRMIAGVCGGLADYLKIDSALVRLIFILLALADGAGILIYFVMWFIVPTQSRVEASPEETVRDGAEEFAERARQMGGEVRDAVRHPHPQTGLVIGLVLIAIGVVVLLENLPIPWLGWLRLGLLWPVLLIVAGIILLTRFVKEE